ncbi:hypothetical protein LJC41_01320 [Desulfosarcina sp. OttesenSCG-928-G17]|nr:hypothetical protein [Desulfosarcina sp. OttesenSCG-928-G17]
MLALGTNTLKNTRCSGKILKALTDDGFMLKAPLDATRRTISQYGSEYALSSDIEAKAAQKRAERITSKLKEKMIPLETHLSNIKRIKERLELAKSQGMDFGQIQREFQTLYPELYAECGLDRATSFEEMLRFVHSREILLLERMDELDEDAQKAKEQIIAELKSRAEQKDAIKKEILKFFRLIGFDMFSKAETDAVFKWLNNNPDILASLGASAPFDIENGVFGYR